MKKNKETVIEKLLKPLEDNTEKEKKTKRLKYNSLINKLKKDKNNMIVGNYTVKKRFILFRLCSNFFTKMKYVIFKSINKI